MSSAKTPWPWSILHSSKGWRICGVVSWRRGKTRIPAAPPHHLAALAPPRGYMAMTLLLIVLAVPLLAEGSSQQAHSLSPAPREVKALPERDLAHEVQTILSLKCAECHGARVARPKGKFGNVEDLKQLTGFPHFVRPFPRFRRGVGCCRIPPCSCAHSRASHSPLMRRGCHRVYRRTPSGRGRRNKPRVTGAGAHPHRQGWRHRARCRQQAHPKVCYALRSG